MTMTLEYKIKRNLEKKRLEIKELELKLAQSKAYIEALEDVLRLESEAEANAPNLK